MIPAVRRSISSLAFLATAAVVSAQTTGYGAIYRSIRLLQSQKLVQAPVQLNPLQPTGFPNPPPKIPVEGKLPQAPDPTGKFQIVSAGVPSVQGEMIRIENGAEFTYKGYRILADTAEGSRITHIFTLTGHVQVLGSDTVVRGERIIVDLDNETYRAFNAESQISPKVMGGQIRDKVYVKGQESFGGQRETRTYGADFTTCDLDHPHYDISGDDTIVRPGRRAIFRRARIRLFGRTILKLPFLSIPLDDRTYQNLPVIGQSQDEGYFIKTNYGIPLHGQSDLQTRLDYMSKLGVGYGGTYRYDTTNLGGYLRFYKVSGTVDTLNFANEHRQRLGWGLLTITTDFQRGNYLTAPSSTILQNRVSLAMPTGRGNTTLGFNRTSNETAGYNTNNQSITVSDQRELLRNIRTSVDLNWLTSKQSSGSTDSSREQLDVLFKATDDFRKGTASLEYQRSIPIGDTSTFFSGSDRTPVISLQSDSRRLLGDAAGRSFPFRTELSIGEYQNYSTQNHVSRGAFDINLQKPDMTQNRFRVSYNGEFKQSFYSDDTAQYVLNFGSQFSYRLGHDTSANLRYNYLHPFGYTPLAIDRAGRTDLATLDVSYRPLRTLLAGLQTGYDFEQVDAQQTPWQQVGVRTEWVPRRWFLFRTLSTYDTFQGEWSSVRLDFGYQPGATMVTVGARYDGIRKVWSNANLFLNNLKVGRANFSAILSYNGYTKQFDSRQYSMIYDLHCAEAVLTISENNVGFRAGREVQFFIRLKAFPFDSPFGIGRQGQPVGTGTGRDF